jgi:hypothetical protein
MILKSVLITLNTYGVEKGSYDCTITVTERYGDIQMKLPPEASSAFVEQTKALIHKFTVRAADQLNRDLELSHPELKAVPQISNTSTDGISDSTIS